MVLGLLWIVALIVLTPLSLIMRYIMPHHKTKIDKESLTAGEIYDRWEEKDETKRFGLADVLYRFFVIQLAFMWAYFTQPFAFISYTFKVNYAWYGLYSGTVLSLCWPFMPVALAIM